MRSDLELNNLAIQLRKKWGEDEYSSVDISKLASLQDNITLITIEMPSEMSGMCVKSDNEIIIAVNSTMSLGRQRFTIAHELYHAYYNDLGCRESGGLLFVRGCFAMKREPVSRLPQVWKY